jgi:hypothetical protein
MQLKTGCLRTLNLSFLPAEVLRHAGRFATKAPPPNKHRDFSNPYNAKLPEFGQLGIIVYRNVSCFMRTPTLLLIFILATACTAQKSALESTAMEASAATDERQQERKIIYNAYLTLTVEQADTANQSLQSIAKNYGGYVNELGTYRSVIRVKSDQLESAIVAIGQVGRLDRKSIRGQDVTEAYLDYQIRLDNAQQARGRYLELLDKATTVDEILKVEKELERLNETIDLLKGKINRIDHLDAYATITIELKERRKPGVLGYIGIGIYRGVRWLFVRG